MALAWAHLESIPMLYDIRTMVIQICFMSPHGPETRCRAWHRSWGEELRAAYLFQSVRTDTRRSERTAPRKTILRASTKQVRGSGT